jgi:hypothetical protein
VVISLEIQYPPGLGAPLPKETLFIVEFIYHIYFE